MAKLIMMTSMIEPFIFFHPCKRVNYGSTFMITSLVLIRTKKTYLTIECMSATIA